MRYSKEKKQELVLKWEQSNQSRKQFSKSNALCYASFLNWTKSFSSSTNSDFSDSFTRIEDNFSGRTKIALPNGVLIETDQIMTNDLLKTLSHV